MKKTLLALLISFATLTTAFASWQPPKSGEDGIWQVIEFCPLRSSHNCNGGAY